jgi:hypothetical protein
VDWDGSLVEAIPSSLLSPLDCFETWQCCLRKEKQLHDVQHRKKDVLFANVQVSTDVVLNGNMPNLDAVSRSTAGRSAYSGTCSLFFQQSRNRPTGSRALSEHCQAYSWRRCRPLSLLCGVNA